MNRRITALVLVSVMLMSCACSKTGVSVDESTADIIESHITEVSEVIESNAGAAFSQGLEFISNGDGTATLAGIGECIDSNLSIPSVTPDGDTVTAIADGAFQACQTITSVEIPDTVTSIGESAFEQCSGLTDISIPDSVTEIGANALNDCVSLQEVTIPENFTVEDLDAAQIGSAIFGEDMEGIPENCRINGEQIQSWLDSRGFEALVEAAQTINVNEQDIRDAISEAGEEIGFTLPAGF